MQAVILAAGRGTRLQQLTLNRSKAMMPIAGMPMISRVIGMLKAAGLQEFIIVAHPEDHELLSLLNGQSDIQITYQAERKGAAHALSMAAPLIRDDFVLSACDNLVHQAEADAFIADFVDASPRPAGLLTLMEVPPEKTGSMGMVDWNGKLIQRIIEKPGPGSVNSKVASMPLYCFQQRFLDYLPLLSPSIRGEYELQDAMQMMISGTKALHGKLLSGRWTLTDPKDLLELNLAFLSRETCIAPADLPESTKFFQPYLIEPGAIIEADVSIGPGVVIETASKIGRGACLRNSLVLRGAQVPAGEFVENQIFG